LFFIFPNPKTAARITVIRANISVLQIFGTYWHSIFQPIKTQILILWNF